ncbi:hypothetical protein [Natrinema soli]|uniref:hypothetical protein n=1 Tax=Natrinema soli TaxID=1930624 RepID=UPI0023631572|nr:hypothetical protein [Natrinema soli]
MVPHRADESARRRPTAGRAHGRAVDAAHLEGRVVVEAGATVEPGVVIEGPMRPRHPVKRSTGIAGDWLRSDPS